MLRESDAVKAQLDGPVDQVCRVDERTVRKNFRVKVKVKRLHGQPLPFPELGILARPLFRKDRKQIEGGSQERWEAVPFPRGTV